MLSWGTAPQASDYTQSGPLWRDLDAQNGWEMAIFECPLTPRLVLWARVGGRRSELIARDQNRLKRIQGRDAASSILSENLHGAEASVIAVRAGVARGHHTRDGGVPVAGCARSDGLTVVVCARGGGGHSMVGRARAGRR